MNPPRTSDPATCKHLGNISGNSGAYFGRAFLRCDECGTELQYIPEDHPFSLRQKEALERLRTLSQERIAASERKRKHEQNRTQP